MINRRDIYEKKRIISTLFISLYFNRLYNSMLIENSIKYDTVAAKKEKHANKIPSYRLGSVPRFIIFAISQIYDYFMFNTINKATFWENRVILSLQFDSSISIIKKKKEKKNYCKSICTYFIIIKFEKKNEFFTDLLQNI